MSPGEFLFRVESPRNSAPFDIRVWEGEEASRVCLRYECSGAHFHNGIRGVLLAVVKWSSLLWLVGQLLSS